MVDIALILATVAAEVVMGGLVLIKNPHARVNRLLAATIAGTMLWTVVSFLSDRVTTQALLVNRLVFVGPVLIGLSFWLLIQELTGRRAQAWQRLSIQLGATGLLVATVSPGIVEDIRPRLTDGKFTGYDLIHGPLYWVFLFYFLVAMAGAIMILYRYYRSSSGTRRVQSRYILIGSIAAAVWGIVTSVLLTLLVGSSMYAQYGALSGFIFSGFLAYSIIKHRFLDIRLVVARAVAYTLLLTTLAGGYAAVIFVLSQLFLPISTNPLIQTTTNTILALILAFTFQPLRRVFEKITERIFFQDHYDTQEVLGKLTQILVSELDLERIMRRSLAELCRSLHIQYAQLVVFDHDRVYRVEHFGPVPRKLMTAPMLRELERPLEVSDELEPGPQKQLMDDHGLRVAVQLRTREEFIGYLLLGDKLSGDIYSGQDIDTLGIMARELAIAISNAKAYTEIAAFNVTLQARVDHATNRLRVANRHLKELDHAKDEFISMASHQLRTPLTTIKGYLSMMLEGDAGKLNQSQAEFTNYAFTASERMVNLISDLLNVSRLSAGRFLIQARPIDMVEMVADEVRQLQSHADAKNLYLKFDRPTQTFPLVEIDDNKTRQVIMNFIDNAIYYTKTGGVTVNLSLVGEGETHDRVRLTVTDTGIGVPREAQKKLFSKFYRAENAQTVRPDGTGLGLYLAKRVIEDQDGTIIFSSTEGQGSTFGFELPLKPLPKHKKETTSHGRN